MHIIFDQNLVSELRQKYIVLELDTIIQEGLEKPLILYGLIDNIGLLDLMNLPDLINQHQTMIEQYKSCKWNDTILNANALKGQWRGELDEFYDLVISTATEYMSDNVVWDGIRIVSPLD